MWTELHQNFTKSPLRVSKMFPDKPDSRCYNNNRWQDRSETFPSQVSCDLRVFQYFHYPFLLYFTDIIFSLLFEVNLLDELKKPIGLLFEIFVVKFARISLLF